MIKTSISVVLVLLLSLTLGKAQDSIAGYVIKKEQRSVLIDLGTQKVQEDQQFILRKPGGYITHPVTGKKIREAPEEIGRLVVKEVFEEYSRALLVPKSKIRDVAVGMPLYALSQEEIAKNPIRQTLAVHSLQVVGARGSLVGQYMADLLVQKLYRQGNFRIIDRSTLDAQLDEQDLGASGYVSENQVASLGRTAGVNYFVVGNVDVEVRETNTGLPFQTVMKGLEIATGENLGSEYISNAEIRKLTAVARVTLRLVDVETGEIKFICTEEQLMQGKSNIALEGGFLGGAVINGGLTQFMKTVSGKAAESALLNASAYINRYFEGDIESAHYDGNKVNSKMQEETLSQLGDIKEGNLCFYSKNENEFKIGKVLQIKKGKRIEVGKSITDKYGVMVKPHRGHFLESLKKGRWYYKINHFSKDIIGRNCVFLKNSELIKGKVINMHNSEPILIVEGYDLGSSSVFKVDYNIAYIEDSYEAFMKHTKTSTPAVIREFQFHLQLEQRWNRQIDNLKDYYIKGENLNPKKGDTALVWINGIALKKTIINIGDNYIVVSDKGKLKKMKRESTSIYIPEKENRFRIENNIIRDEDKITMKPGIVATSEDDNYYYRDGNYPEIVKNQILGILVGYRNNFVIYYKDFEKPGVWKVRQVSNESVVIVDL